MTDSNLNCFVDHCQKVHNFKPIPCSFSNCNFIAVNHQGYALHISKFHSKHIVFTGNEFQCPYENCRSAFTKKDHLERHVRVHENDLFSCVFCPYKSGQVKELNNHYRRHYKIFEYECDLCDKSYVRATNLHQHRENCHQTGEAFKCHLCEYSSTKMKLQLHYRNKHKMSSQWNKVKKSFDTFEK